MHDSSLFNIFAVILVVLVLAGCLYDYLHRFLNIIIHIISRASRLYKIRVTLFEILTELIEFGSAHEVAANSLR